MDPRTEEETEATPLPDSVEDVAVEPDDGAEKMRCQVAAWAGRMPACACTGLYLAALDRAGGCALSRPCG